MKNKEHIQHNLRFVRQKIQAASEECGRNSKEVRLMCVSKNAEVEDIKEAVEQGEHLFGENYTQQALPKIDLLSGSLSKSSVANPIRFHFIGHLQQNKIKKVCQYFYRIDSVDSVSLASSIASEFEKTDLFQKNPQLTFPILIEVKTSKDPSKYGILPETLPFLLESVLSFSNLHIEGLMTMATHTQEEKEIRRCFSLLRETRNKMESCFSISLPVLSMGMSGDYVYAIKEGSTLLRIGSAIFGGYHEHNQ